MEIKKPTLIVDLKKVERNIKRMTDKFKSSGIEFRPHFKTHQSHFIADIFRKQGVTKCTVSSVGMAKYFMEDGWDDISIAFPANMLETNEMNALAKQIKLNILVDSVEKVNVLSEKISSKIALFIEIDTGYFRSGILFDKKLEINEIINAIKKVPQFSFAGFLSHTGNTYTQSSKDNILSLFDAARIKLVELKHYYLKDYPHLILSMGDTPSASLAIKFDDIDEIRPGNFVFYDVTQHLLGSCDLNDIAVAVYCPVVAKYPERNQITVYGGAVHLSKEKAIMNGKEIYGLISLIDNQGFGNVLADSYVESLSQEHGIICMPLKVIEQLKLGDIIAIFPVHSCITVDLNREILSLDGKSISKFRTY